MVINILPKKVLLFLLRNFNGSNTVSSISNEFSMNRVGIWRLLKKLEFQDYIKLTSIDNRKTSTYLVKLNWNNALLDKLLSFYLTDEAIKEKKWFQKLKGLERVVEFLILYIPEDESQKITIISVIPNKKIKIYHTPGELGEERDINTINLTELEFIQEFTKKNQDFIGQINNGMVLFGQERFIQIMKQIHLRNH
jgi:hypothetical protein